MQQLINSLEMMAKTGTEFEGKTALCTIVAELMPNNKPDIFTIYHLPTLKQISKDNKNNIIKCLFLLIKDFCSSFNVVRNMNSTQMIEAANLCFEESVDYRLEDFVLMFSLAKRGKFVTIYDRIDISVIIEIMDKYYVPRAKAIQQIEIEKQENYKLLQEQKQIEKEKNGQVKDFSKQLKELADKIELSTKQEKDNKRIFTDDYISERLNKITLKL